MRRWPNASSAPTYSEKVATRCAWPAVYAVLRLEGEDERLDRLLLTRLELEVAGEGRTCDQDRDDEQRDDRSTQLQVHPPEPQPQQRKRKRPDVEGKDLPQHLDIWLVATQCDRDAHERRMHEQVRGRAKGRRDNAGESSSQRLVGS